MEASTVASFYKLAVADEKAGFSLEDMISLLNAGLTVEALLDLIEQTHKRGTHEAVFSKMGDVSFRALC